MTKTTKPWRHQCAACSKEIHNLMIESPMVTNKNWYGILGFYGLSEDRQHPSYPARNPLYICIDCMEKALGRKLTKEDLKPVNFNTYFSIYYFRNIPIETVIRIRMLVHTYVLQTQTQDTGQWQRESDIVAGLMISLDNPWLHSIYSPVHEQKNKIK